MRYQDLSIAKAKNSGPSPKNHYNTVEQTDMPIDLNDYVGSEYLLEKLGQGQTQDRFIYEGQRTWLMDESAALEKKYSIGKEDGKIEGKIEIAQALKAKGFSNNEISEITGLSLDEIDSL